MIHTIHGERYGTIEISDVIKKVYFHKDDVEYSIREGNTFYHHNKLWKVRFKNNGVILKVRGWIEIGERNHDPHY